MIAVDAQVFIKNGKIIDNSIYDKADKNKDLLKGKQVPIDQLNKCGG
jgi:hypothetical protein